MEEIYFDNAATTRTDPEVAALMTHVLCEEYGNPSSLHSRGGAGPAFDRAGIPAARGGTGNEARKRQDSLYLGRNRGE